jgi:hypothetical protein
MKAVYFHESTESFVKCFSNELIICFHMKRKIIQVPANKKFRHLKFHKRYLNVSGEQHTEAVTDDEVRIECLVLECMERYRLCRDD